MKVFSFTGLILEIVIYVARKETEEKTIIVLYDMEQGLLLLTKTKIKILFNGFNGILE